MRTVRDLTPAALPAARAFLATHLRTAVFLLYSLERFGPEMKDHRDSGWFTIVEEDDQIVAVVSATRRGHLLIETGGRPDLGDVLLGGLGDRLTAIDGVVGEWAAAMSVWPALCRRDGLSVVHETCNVVYAAALAGATAPAKSSCHSRVLTIDDFDAWYPLFHALEEQEGVAIHGTREQVRQRFTLARWRWYGAFVGTELVAVVCLDLAVGGTGHAGGLFVRPDCRRQGFGRAVMTALMHDRTSGPPLEQITLFTREDNTSARALFEALGFKADGRFGFLLGAWKKEEGTFRHPP